MDIDRLSDASGGDWALCRGSGVLGGEGVRARRCTSDPAEETSGDRIPLEPSRGVFVGYAGVMGVLSPDKRGATRDTQGSINGFPSTSNVSKEDKRHNHDGNEYS